MKIYAKVDAGCQCFDLTELVMELSPFLCYIGFCSLFLLFVGLDPAVP